MGPEPGKASESSPSEEEERRAALRLAALQSLKASAASKKTALNKDALTTDRAIRNTDENTADPTSTPESIACSSASKFPEQEPVHPFSKRSAGRTGYRDVDMPDADTTDILSYIEYDQDHKSVLTDARSARPRISYADEFSTRPIAPSGELGVARWMDLPLDSIASSPPIHMTPKAFPARRTMTSDTVKQDPHAVAMSITQNTFAKFVNRPMRGPFIIEWSDDEDEDGSDTERLTNSSLARESPRDRKSSSVISSAVLTEKEREIRRMMARIEELERKKRLQNEPASGAINLHDAHPPTILGKRSATTEVEAEEETPASSKVGCSSMPRRSFRAYRAQKTKTENSTTGRILSGISYVRFRLR